MTRNANDGPQSASLRFSYHPGLDSNRKAIEQGNAEFPQYRLPVVLALLDRDDEAVQMTDARLGEFGDADNPFAQEFRAYADRFKEQLSDLSALAG